MPIFETGRGTRMQLVLPRTTWKELESVVEGYEQLKRERKVTEKALSVIEKGRVAVLAGHQIALANAIRLGKEEPEEPDLASLYKEEQAARRRLDAIEIALDDTETELVAVLDEHRAAWTEEAQATFEEAKAEYAEKVEALAMARLKVSAKFALLRWVRGFPEEEVSYRVRAGYVGKLQSVNGDPYLFEQVIDALRDDASASPSAPRATGPGSQWLPRASG